MCWIDITNLIVGIVSAIATFGATATSLYLALRDRRQRIDCVFMWETATNNKPMLILNNIGDYTVIVDRIDVYFDKQKIGRFDILRTSEYCENAIISPNKEVRITMNSKKLNLGIKGRAARNPDTIYKLTAVVTTTSKKRYKSCYGYCYNDLSGLTFLEALGE